MQLCREAAESSKFLLKPDTGEILAIWIMITMPWKITSGNTNPWQNLFWTLKGREFQEWRTSLCESPG